MKTRIAILAVFMCLPWLPAAADNNSVLDAMNRGLVGKAPSSPRGRKMTPAQWTRAQQAALDKSEEIMHRALKQPGLLAQYAFMQTHYDANDERVFRLIFGQYLSWFQTWIGDYDGAGESFSVTQGAQADDAPTPVASAYHAKPADEAILELTGLRKVVFFNESHSRPVTRTLTVQLLARLRAQGFTYFAAETLYTAHADALKGGHADARSGFYINEPIYGEMVRAALRLGFKVIAYDAEDVASSDAREKAGAQSLYDQVLRNDPDARLVVNAGFSHIQKSGDYLGGSSIAENFQKISGIEPLSVEQTMMIEHPQADQNHPYYSAAIQVEHFSRPFVYVSDAGTPWTLKPGQYDISVFFPPESHSDNRPDWVSLGGTRQPFSVTGDECHGHFPCLIQAHYENEDEQSVAADRVLLNLVDAQAPAGGGFLAGHGSAYSRLYLFPGNYRISAIDRDGKVLATRNINVIAQAAVSSGAISRYRDPGRSQRVSRELPAAEF
jgi:hypothetical protein